MAATIVAAIFFAIVRHRVKGLPIEATIGIIYAVVAAATLFMIGKCTGGHTHVQDMLMGSLLWVEWSDFLRALLVFLGAGACLVLCRRPLQRISDKDEEEHGKHAGTFLWDFLFYALCGVVITMAVHLAGVVVVFCFLIVPATFSALFAVSWGARLTLTWLVGAASSAAGLLFSHWLDFSAGVSVSLFMGIFLVLGALFSLARPRSATLLEDEKAERRPATPGRSSGGESSAAAVRTPELKEVSS
jgi:ABC-type Mn2+/Zn2+ transport system permease subunit